VRATALPCSSPKPCANRRLRAIPAIAFALAVGVHQGGASESTSAREPPAAYGRAIFNRRGPVDSANPSGLAINGWRKLTRFAISLSI
jgi:hypothetical protein